MKNALKCTLTLAAGVLALALPTLAGVNITPKAMPEPGTIVMLVGGLATVIGFAQVPQGLARTDFFRVARMHGQVWWYVFGLSFVVTALVETFWPYRVLPSSTSRRWTSNAILQVASTAVIAGAFQLTGIALAAAIQATRHGALNKNPLPHLFCDWIRGAGPYKLTSPTDSSIQSRCSGVSTRFITRKPIGSHDRASLSSLRRDSLASLPVGGNRSHRSAAQRSAICLTGSRCAGFFHPRKSAISRNG